MQTVVEGTKGLGLLLDINSDRVLSILIILAALAAVGLVGVEYFGSYLVQDSVSTMANIG